MYCANSAQILKGIDDINACDFAVRQILTDLMIALHMNMIKTRDRQRFTDDRMVQIDTKIGLHKNTDL